MYKKIIGIFQALKAQQKKSVKQGVYPIHGIVHAIITM